MMNWHDITVEALRVSVSMLSGCKTECPSTFPCNCDYQARVLQAAIEPVVKKREARAYLDGMQCGGRTARRVPR